MIKKSLFFVIIFLSFSFSVFAESIEKYEVNIVLQKDSSLLVEEKIIYDFGENQKHGIYRFIPNGFTVEGQEKMFGLESRKLEFSNLEVYQDGEPASLAEINQNDENNNYFIKIGEANKFISGVHSYLIKYKVDGALRYFDDYDEIYWNAIGLDWTVPIESVIIKVSSDDINFNNSSCYQGGLKSTENCIIDENLFKNSRVLNPREGMTVALSFAKGEAVENEIWKLNGKGWFILILSFIIFVIVTIIILMRNYLNKYKPNKPIIPIYKPYKSYHPAITGYLIDKKLDPRDLTAGILSLAQKGYMEIERTEEKGILFGKNIDYIFRLKTSLEYVNDNLDKFFIELIFTKNEFNLNEIINKIRVSGFAITNNNENKLEDKDLIKEVKLSDLVMRSSDIIEKRQKIDKWLKDYSEKNEYIENSNFNKYISFTALVPFIVVFISIFFGFVSFLTPIIVFMAIISFLLLLLAFSRYTQKGWEVKNNLEGFKMFLNYTEKERIKYFNSPEKNPQEFLEYLPYAIAFNVEDKWKDQFKNITIAKPDWYVGSNTFIVSDMLGDISTMTDSINSSLATAAVSGSGSSGGGFSGGGAGGGGGGSW